MLRTFRDLIKPERAEPLWANAAPVLSAQRSELKTLKDVQDTARAHNCNLSSLREGIRAGLFSASAIDPETPLSTLGFRVFVVEFFGRREPNGLSLPYGEREMTVLQTRSGVAAGGQGIALGTYDRVVDSAEKHVLLVYVKPPSKR